MSQPLPVRYELADNIAFLTLDRPARRNALSREMLQALKAHLREIADNPQARVVILRAAGPADREFKSLKRPGAWPWSRATKPFGGTL